MKIQICESCKGTGEITTYVGYYNPDKVTEACCNCNGTGRVLAGSYSYTVPFNTDKKLIYEMDDKIVALLRELQDKT